MISRQAFFPLPPIPLLLFTLTLLSPTPARAVLCASSTHSLHYVPGTGTSTAPQNCPDTFRCHEAKQPAAPWLLKVNPNCDPNTQGCRIQLRVPLETPGNKGNIADVGVFGAPKPLIYWFEGPSPPGSCEPRFDTSCGQIGICGYPGSDITTDSFETVLQIDGVSCSNLTNPNLTTYSISVFTCESRFSCPQRLDIGGLDFAPQTVAAMLGCEAPPMEACPGDGDCAACRQVGPAGVSVGGGGGSASPPGSGPEEGLSYRAGGVGHMGFPGAPASLFSGVATRSTTGLGRYWMHPWAERIVLDPDATHVWLLTRHGTFREFSNPDAGGLYQSVAPSDEYRQLTDTGTGWELRDLEGTVQHFDASGRWTQTTDRNGNTTAAAYAAGGALTTVIFPDARSLGITYTPDAQLASITEIGIDATTTRTWLYTWSDDDLTRIDQPDGRVWVFSYRDARFPGYLTELKLLGNDGPLASERIEAAFEYDAEGNAVKLWRGVAASTDPGAVDLWELTFDEPILPRETTVTDPLGNPAVITIERDTVSRKTKVTRIEGDCPSCGLGPNSQLTYGDTAHPLRPTREIDGEGHITEWIYDDHGQVITRIEASGTLAERSTTFLYNLDHPRLPELISRPSVAGGAALRESLLIRDASGNEIQRTESGLEAGVAVSHMTLTTYNAVGQVLSIDPPGHGTDDQTAFTYDPARGNLLPLTRTDPLIGPTHFTYDAFNRRITVTDIRGVITRTAYDAADRVLEVRQEGSLPPADDLVTTYEYSPFGDLLRTTLPRGNVIEYAYDPAGRLISIERKPDAETPGERTLYQLDAAGNRTREEHQRWDGTTWVTEARADSTFHTRCQLDRTIQAPGTSEQAITDYRRDCNGNLIQVWDAHHDPATDPPTQSYTYDELDRLTTVSQPWPGGGNTVTGYAYDVQDHLIEVTDAEGNLTTYQYSDRDLLTEEISPASGITTHTYNEHGELIQSIDARGITTARTFDELDRVTTADFPDDSLDITYTYDDPEIPFSQGRLTAITRNGATIAYAYDRFGRTVQDGLLTYTFDANGNRTGIVYPDGVMATYTHDFADREASLTVQRPGQPDEPVITDAEYLPSGPLTSLTLGDSLAETRSFDGRYAPTGIEVTGAAPVLHWTYTTDPVGNPTAITDVLDPTQTRTYTYQDVQYFLTAGSGPWGNLSWSLDKIGNRLTETRDGLTDTYTYALNPGGGNTPLLTQIQLATGGTRTYQHGSAGHLEEVDAAGNLVDLTWDTAGRLSAMERPTGGAVTLTYDGRSYLSAARERRALVFADGFEGGNTCAWNLAEGDPSRTCPAISTPPSFRQLTGPAVEPIYTSEGLLASLSHPTAPEIAHLFYFAGRPVAQLEISGGAETFKYLTTDHLGTPILATDSVGNSLWQGGFEPFGEDYAGAGAAGVFLRFPGQWEDPIWEQASLGVETYYNVFRWYQPGVGRYTSADPAGRQGDQHPHVYAWASPQTWFDPHGLKSRVCCTPIEDAFALRQFKHCFIEVQDTPGEESRTYGLHGMGNARRSWGGPLGCTFENDGFDQDATSDGATECGAWNETCGADECAENQFGLYSRASEYSLMGPNSNTFAGTVARACGLEPPGVAGTWHTPGWGSSPAPSATGKSCPSQRRFR